MYSAVESGLVRAATRPMKANSASPHMPIASRRTARIPTTAAYRAQHHQDAAEQHGLVRGAERGNGEVLDRRRGEVDGGLADRDHRRALRDGEAGDELRRADGDRRREHACHGPGEGMRSPGLIVGEGGR